MRVSVHRPSSSVSHTKPPTPESATLLVGCRLAADVPGGLMVAFCSSMLRTLLRMDVPQSIVMLSEAPAATPPSAMRTGVPGKLGTGPLAVPLL